MILNKILKYFPYKEIREEQLLATVFGLKTFMESDKKFCIIEAGTGVGKSAIGVTISRLVNQSLPPVPEYGMGSYFLTTQKILQNQYENDFGFPAGNMISLYSSSNYGCKYHKQNTCQTSQQMLKTTKKSSSFFKACTTNCIYKNKKKDFLASHESVTNFQYFITESTYSGKITPRNCLIVDEAHNTEDVLSKFVEVAVSQYFCEKIVKAKWPDKITPAAFVNWIRNVYYPKIQSQILHFENQIAKLGLASKMKELTSISLKYDMLTNHSNKLDIFLRDYNTDNWVMEKQQTEKRGYVRIVYRAIDISKFAESYLFRMGRKVILMSATILNAESFAQSLGIDKNNYDSISIPSPFPKANRPIILANIGRMSSKEIDMTLPKVKNAVMEILNNHKNEKGIIHCHTYKIANYIKKNIKSKRILTHDSTNREIILKKHIDSKEPTVLLSPSMTEGVDLKGKLSQFQIICKIPYPYLGDPIIRKRMAKNKKWYALKTAISIVQAFGRSVRSKEDNAITYILDGDWNYFYKKNKDVFPKEFIECIVQ